MQAGECNCLTKITDSVLTMIQMRPKMGKLEIDYNKLHDAFFRWQTKPFMSIHGDLYFEGKVGYCYPPCINHQYSIQSL